MAQTEKLEAKPTSAAAGLLDDALDTANGVASKVSAKAKDVAGNAREYATETVENVNSVIKENPVQALLVGFGIGCLVGVVVTALVKR